MDNRSNRTAIEHCSLGIEQYVRFRADASMHIDSAIATDPDLCLPHVVKAWMLHGAGDASFSSEIAKLVTRSKNLLSDSNTREAGLLRALELSSSGHRVEGATELDKLVRQSPRDLFLQTLAHEEIFWLGQPEWMRSIIERSATQWKEVDQGYSAFLSLRAFANEEAGYFDAAENYGMAAVEIDPSDVWGAHAVAHVLLMKSEIQRGINFLESLCSNWGMANQMQHHLWWHQCLFLMETGDHDQVLALLDTQIRNPDSPLIKASPAATIDINNYASLLLRLELYDVDVSQQWQSLAVLCANRTTNHASAFSNIHDMMVLTATDQLELAQKLLNSMTEQFKSTDRSGSLAESYREVGIPVCAAIMAHRTKDYKKVLNVLGAARHRLSLMGASHAQRDVFYHLLVHAARQEQETDLLSTILAEIEQLGFSNVPGRAAYKQRGH